MIVLDYLHWHYGVAPKKIWEIGGNYVEATWHRFLIVQHFKTLFSPWHRRKPSDFGGGATIGGRVADAASDFYIRILAAFVRSSIILAGLVAEVFVVGIFLAFFCIWILWPLAAVSLISKGVSIFF